MVSYHFFSSPDVSFFVLKSYALNTLKLTRVNFSRVFGVLCYYSIPNTLYALASGTPCPSQKGDLSTIREGRRIMPEVARKWLFACCIAIAIFV